LHGLVDQLYDSAAVLVHGDISPKNILIRDGAPVILNAECATMGDPVFDVAFCLSHLVLKSIHVAPMTASYHADALAFWCAYTPHVFWEDAAQIEARLMRLLPALMLARVDGKSPVTYLDRTKQSRVRYVSRDLILTPATDLADLLARVANESAMT